MTTATELKDQILSRAAADGNFRAHLIADPKSAIAAETGQSIPDGFDVMVHEDCATTAHLVLPPSPHLSEAELENITGGVFIWMYVSDGSSS